jgi:hypothetical protein
MNLVVVIGAPVSGTLTGHSAINGAKIPEDASVVLTSNDPLVATVPGTLPVPAGGVNSLKFPVTVLGTGSTDIHVTVRVPGSDGKPDQIFESTSNLLVTPLPIPGLVSVELILTSP